jgi:hypothetical protein
MDGETPVVKLLAKFNLILLNIFTASGLRIGHGN